MHDKMPSPCVDCRKAVNQCKLVPYEGRTHGFFNFGRGNGSDYQSTLRMMDAFLVEEGFLKPPSK